MTFLLDMDHHAMTGKLYRADAYAQTCEVSVLSVTDRGGIILDRTVFYAAAGGQPGDKGAIEIPGFGRIEIATAVYDADKETIVHVPAAPLTGPIAPGTIATASLDWDTRHKLMRMHTGLHLLCSLVKFPVTGGQIGAGEGRLDFDIADADAIDKDRLTGELRALIAGHHSVTEQWITDAELEANPGLVRTMSVKPPMGSGRVRLVLIGADGAIDRQPCGGTHVKNTSEIGSLTVTKIEKKGKLNRRIRVAFG
jgi:misacylated tRNA(Ala) deacylase